MTPHRNKQGLKLILQACKSVPVVSSDQSRDNIFFRVAIQKAARSGYSKKSATCLWLFIKVHNFICVVRLLQLFFLSHFLQGGVPHKPPPGWYQGGPIRQTFFLCENLYVILGGSETVLCETSWIQSQYWF